MPRWRPESLRYSLPLSLSSPRRGMGRRWRTRCTPPAHPLVPLAPDRLKLDPGGGDVDGAEGAEVEALGTGPAMSDEIDFEKSGPRVVPLREGADGDRVAEPGPDPRGGGPARGSGGPRGGEEPAERGRTHVADELVELGGERQLASAGGPAEEPGDEGMEAMRGEAAGATSRVSRWRSSGTKGGRGCGPMCPVACHKTSTTAATAGP